MLVLKNAGTFETLATWPSEETNANAQVVLERAGRTCYQSETSPITPESAQGFIARAIKRTHYSVIEHGWRGYIFTFKHRISAANAQNAILRAFYPEDKHLFMTFDKIHMVVSGNLETWRKLCVAGKLPKVIIKDLEHFAPAVFLLEPKATEYAEVVSIVPVLSRNSLCSCQETLAHIAQTTRYNNHSRGFTHELVRHRVPVFSQESTRYVDESDFEMIVPPHRDETLRYSTHANMERIGGSDDFSFQDFLDITEIGYKVFRSAGWEPEDARQLLSTAIKAQIIMSCNLEEYRYIFYRRAAKSAHWEIRRTMCMQLADMQNTYPALFTKFTRSQGEDANGLAWYDYATKEYTYGN